MASSNGCHIHIPVIINSIRVNEACEDEAKKYYIVYQTLFVLSRMQPLYIVGVTKWKQPHMKTLFILERY